MTIHVMLDLETWGTEPGCDIRSIGATIFDPFAGTIGSLSIIESVSDARPVTMLTTAGQFYMATDNPIIGNKADGWVETVGFTPNVIDPAYDQTNQVYRRWGLKRDPRTVQWWSEQSPEAKAAFAAAVPLDEACERFTIWLNGVATPDTVPPSGGHPNVRLWSHGPSFDPPILAAVYAACGMPVPWHYRAPRDTRTALDMAGIDDHSAFINQFATGTYHHALDDAITQAKAMLHAHDIVNGWRWANDQLNKMRGGQDDQETRDAEGAT